MFTIRPATTGDQKEIKALIRTTRLNPMGLEWPNFVVAEDESGRFIGCGQIKKHRDGSRELASIAVYKAWRKKDVARTIIQHLLFHSERPLWLMCESSLIPFYEKFQFQTITDPQQLPAHFRRVYRFWRIIDRLFQPAHKLAIMMLIG